MDCKDIMTETLACKILNISRKHTFEMRKKLISKWLYVIIQINLVVIKKNFRM